MNKQESRLLYNRAIIDKIKEIIEKYPYLRFGQILVNLDIVHSEGDGYAIDPFYEEPEDMWNRIISNIISNPKYCKE